jgi:hypothetical protein
LNDHIRSKATGKRFADSKEADTISKITKSIEQLEEETNLTDVFEVGKRYITFLQEYDHAAAKASVEYYDAFIKHCLKPV